MKINFEDDDKVEVPMSPLIDCVFLLLIFFLVTTMMKKWEQQIPLSIPSSTSSLSTVQGGDQPIVLSVDGRRIYQVVNVDAYSGEGSYIPVADLPGFLDQLKQKYGTEIVIDVSAYRTVSVKDVIDVFDACQIAGFDQTRVRLGSMPPGNNLQYQ